MWPFKKVIEKQIKNMKDDFPVDDATKLFRELSTERIESLPIEISFQLMMDFYRDFRSRDLLSLEEGGDMLLFQWGIFDWGDGPRFEIDLTRQFNLPDGDDSSYMQMHLVYRFHVIEELSNLGSGDKWCRHPQQLPAFHTLVHGSPQLAIAARYHSESAELFLEDV